MRIAFFDFDGTITKQDTLIKFIRFFVGDMRFIVGILVLLPKFIAYKFNLVSNQYIKENITKYFFSNIDVAEFKTKAERFSLNNIDILVRKNALKRIKWHQKNGHKVVIVSASIDYWLKPWCDKNHIDLIATKLEIKDNKITGRLDNKNCFGGEKVRRIMGKYRLSDYDYIYAYGDSRGDYEMLQISSEKSYKPFR